MIVEADGLEPSISGAPVSLPVNIMPPDKKGRYLPSRAFTTTTFKLFNKNEKQN